MPFDFAKGVQASLAARREVQAAAAAAEATLNNILANLDSSARLNLNTPADGNCLFWSLLQGGLAELGDMQLSISELRRIALSLATQEELQLAAISTTSAEKPDGLSVEEYSKGMQAGLWGNHLTIACLARAFHRDITVVGMGSVNGGDASGHLETAIWIGHRGEWHYHGVEYNTEQRP